MILENSNDQKLHCSMITRELPNRKYYHLKESGIPINFCLGLIESYIIEFNKNPLFSKTEEKIKRQRHNSCFQGRIFVSQ